MSAMTPKKESALGLTHKRLKYNSILWQTAQDSSTVKHIEVKAVFRHRLFGISARLPDCSCRFIQRMNACIRATAKQRKTMFMGRRMLLRLSVKVLQLPISQCCQLQTPSRASNAKI